MGEEWHPRSIPLVLTTEEQTADGGSVVAVTARFGVKSQKQAEFIIFRWYSDQQIVTVTGGVVMETETQKNSPIVELARKRAANFSAHSGRRKNGFYDMRGWIAALGVLATLIAILTQLYQTQLKSYPGLELGARILFVATPALASTLAAFASKKYAKGDWWITRSASEEIKKELYFYRTIWPKDKRNEMLEASLNRIQRQVYQALGGVFSLEEPKKKAVTKNRKPVPQTDQTSKPARDSDFSDLGGDEYFKYRVEEQFNWHNNKINELKGQRDRWTILIMAIGALGTVLATLGGNWGIWVALTASLTSALIGWELLNNNEGAIRNYSKVVLELSILRDHWLNLDQTKIAPEKIQEEIKKMVNGCENVLWAQNIEYIKAMQDALKDDNLEEQAKLANNATQQMVVTYESTSQSMADNTIETFNATLKQTSQQVDGAFQDTVGALKQEASELVQKQLDAASQVLTEAAENITDNAPTLTTSPPQTSQETSQVEADQDAGTDELNQIQAAYPETGEVKG